MAKKLDTLQRIEIAEGVEIQLHLAGPMPRGMAFALDCLIKAAILMVGAFVCTLMGFICSVLFGWNIGSGLSTGLMIAIAFALEFVYSIVFEASRWSATPGKRIVGLKVVRTSGAPISWHQSVVRTMLRGVDWLPFFGVTGIITGLCNDRFQRLGDLAADTLVIYAEPGRPKVVASGGDGIAPFRPGASLTREDQGAIVQYADRFREWPARRAEELAEHLRGLTRVEGQEGVSRIVGMAQWIRGEG